MFAYVNQLIIKLWQRSKPRSSVPGQTNQYLLRHHQLLKSPKGFSLLEVLILAVSTIPFFVIGANGVLQVYSSTMEYRDTVETSIVRNNIVGLLQSPKALQQTLYSNNNDSAFSCLKNPDQDCRPSSSNQSFAIYKADGSLYYDPTNRTAGFTRGGVPCSIGTNEECVIRVNLFWEPVCPADGGAGNCRNPWRLRMRGEFANFVGQDGQIAQNSAIDVGRLSQAQIDTGPMMIPRDPGGSCEAIMAANPNQLNLRPMTYLMNRNEVLNIDVGSFACTDKGVQIEAVQLVSGSTSPAGAGLVATDTGAQFRITYTAATNFFGKDYIDVRVTDTLGRVADVRHYVKVMTPHTWVGGYAGGSWGDARNWCGVVTDGACAAGGNAVTATSNLVFDGTSEPGNQVSEQDASITEVNSIYMTSRNGFSYSGSVRQIGDLTLAGRPSRATGFTHRIPNHCGVSTLELSLADYGASSGLLIESGTFNGSDSHRITNRGAFIRMLAGQFNAPQLFSQGGSQESAINFIYIAAPGTDAGRGSVEFQALNLMVDYTTINSNQRRFMMFGDLEVSGRLEVGAASINRSFMYSPQQWSLDPSNIIARGDVHWLRNREHNDDAPYHRGFRFPRLVFAATGDQDFYTAQFAANTEVALNRGFQALPNIVVRTGGTLHLRSPYYYFSGNFILENPSTNLDFSAVTEIGFRTGNGSWGGNTMYARLPENTFNERGNSVNLLGKAIPANVKVLIAPSHSGLENSLRFIGDTTFLGDVQIYEDATLSRNQLRGSFGGRQILIGGNLSFFSDVLYEEDFYTPANMNPTFVLNGTGNQELIGLPAITGAEVLNSNSMPSAIVYSSGAQITRSGVTLSEHESANYGRFKVPNIIIDKPSGGVDLQGYFRFSQDFIVRSAPGGVDTSRSPLVVFGNYTSYNSYGAGNYRIDAPGVEFQSVILNGWNDTKTGGHRITGTLVARGDLIGANGGYNLIPGRAGRLQTSEASWGNIDLYGNLIITQPMGVYNVRMRGASSSHIYIPPRAFREGDLRYSYYNYGISSGHKEQPIRIDEPGKVVTLSSIGDAYPSLISKLETAGNMDHKDPGKPLEAILRIIVERGTLRLSDNTQVTAIYQSNHSNGSRSSIGKGEIEVMAEGDLDLNGRDLTRARKTTAPSDFTSSYFRSDYLLMPTVTYPTTQLSNCPNNDCSTYTVEPRPDQSF